MQYKLTMRAVICSIVVFTAGPLVADQPSTVALFSFISSFFKDTFTILNLIEKLNNDDQKKIVILCNGCHNCQLTCAELVGGLQALDAQKNLDALKKALEKQDVQEIRTLMATFANEKQISCIVCKKFTQWT